MSFVGSSENWMDKTRGSEVAMDSIYATQICPERAKCLAQGKAKRAQVGRRPGLWYFSPSGNDSRLRLFSRVIF